MLRVENLRRFQLSLEAERARLEKRVTKSYRDFVGRAFQDLLMHTPQYSGQMTASWHILLTNEGAPTSSIAGTTSASASQSATL